MLDLPEAVEKGYLTEADMDVALERLFAARIRLGMFDPPERVPFSTIPISENHSAAHQQLALRAARESIVLLKNDGLLPLDKTDATIAVIGPSATRSEEHTSELQSLMRISYDVFCLKKKKQKQETYTNQHTQTRKV